jgi:murein DD-endopeptidase MepM/ murein hydrolase activator NlpD
VTRRPRLSVFIVPSDGARPVRFHLPRAVVPAVVIAAALTLTTLTALVCDYVRVRRLAASPALLERQLAEQQGLAASLQTRIGEIRLEIGSWRDLHAKIWEPFGPDAGRVQKTRGIGGPGAAAPFEHGGVRPSPLEELERLAETVDEADQNLRALERLMEHAGKALALMPSRWPVRGAVNSEFGRRPSPWEEGTEFHPGLDIAADTGTPVHAPAPSRVVFAGRQPDFGLSVILEHGHDIRSIYGHLSKVLVSAGQTVGRGQLIALTGNSGKSTGPHLHYEILVKGQPVNPRAYLWE